jgi:glycosyltransferase involved in cell wall biosynthesis
MNAERIADRPLVSILLTSYNRERYLGAAIDSVLAQTYGCFELIVSDNCSTDRSVDIAREYARRDNRIRVSVNDRNIGQFENRWHAATLARGEYLKYHDSDDVMYPHCVETMVRALQGEPRAAFALSGSRAWPGGPCPMLLTPKLAYEREFLGGGAFHLGPAAAMFRTEAFRELGGFPIAGVASDYLFWLDACAKVSMLLVSGDLFYYRIHPGQLLADPRIQVEYAKATSAAWTKLHSPDCPLDDATREQAKRNFVYIQARGIVRRVRRGDFAGAAMIVKYAGIRAADWIRYLRPPRRSETAGVPMVTA